MNTTAATTANIIEAAGGFLNITKVSVDTVRPGDIVVAGRLGLIGPGGRVGQVRFVYDASGSYFILSLADGGRAMVMAGGVVEVAR